MPDKPIGRDSGRTKPKSKRGGCSLDHTDLARVYDFYSRTYDKTFGKVFRESREHAIRNLQIRAGERVLEVGVGTGVSLPLYPRDIRIVGIDYSRGMLEQAERRVTEEGLRNVDLLHMDACTMTFPDSTFDVVLAAYVLTAVPDHRKVMSEMVRVCKPGGRIVFLNHLVNGNKVLAFFERLVSPVCEKIGFRTDLSLHHIVDGMPVTVRSEQRLKPLRMWYLVECVNDKLLAAAH
jgi:phosphatidylethanolamine/phosphatidyl-N-methylethanolamine N-methyltransferase